LLFLIGSVLIAVGLSGALLQTAAWFVFEGVCGGAAICLAAVFIDARAEGLKIQYEREIRMDPKKKAYDDMLDRVMELAREGSGRFTRGAVVDLLTLTAFAVAGGGELDDDFGDHYTVAAGPIVMKLTWVDTFKDKENF